ncbi:hypothetical protein BDQ17DRAFT_1385428, partial [Cyathus striatus]
MSEQTVVGVTSKNAAATGRVLVKLVVFSLSLGILPLTSYYASQKYIWNGNSTFAAITAVVAANIVLVAYIITSLLEDRQVSSKSPGNKDESKKN